MEMIAALFCFLHIPSISDLIDARVEAPGLSAFIATFLFGIIAIIS